MAIPGPPVFDADTTAQLQDLVAKGASGGLFFQTDDIQVFTISCDSMYTLRAWADAEGHFFPLLSDFWPHGEVARRFGVLDEEEGFALRGTFLLDRDGLLVWSEVLDIGQGRNFTAYRRALTGLRERQAADAS